MSLVLIAPPASEPVSLAEIRSQLDLGPWEDSDHVTAAIRAARLRGMITAARTACEDYLRQTLITQTWELRLDGFPGFNTRYNRDGYPQIWIPKPPFQSVVSFQYVDVGGVLQTMALDSTYGVNDPTFYSYQLDPGSQTIPARVLPAYARPWPPTRLVANNVILRFIAGYGGPLTLSMTQGSAAITGATFLGTDVGRPLSVPSAGASGTALSTSIASVDEGGNGTAAAAAATTATNVQAYLGIPVPGPILMAIRLLTQFYYEQGGAADAPLPRVVCTLLDPYRNLIA